MRQSTEVVSCLCFSFKDAPAAVAVFTIFYWHARIDANNSGRSFPSLFPNVFFFCLFFSWLSGRPLWRKSQLETHKGRTNKRIKVRGRLAKLRTGPEINKNTTRIKMREASLIISRVRKYKENTSDGLAEQNTCSPPMSDRPSVRPSVQEVDKNNSQEKKKEEMDPKLLF